VPARAIRDPSGLVESSPFVCSEEISAARRQLAGAARIHVVKYERRRRLPERYNRMVEVIPTSAS